MSHILDEWNRGKLESYLIEISRDILEYKDETGEPTGGKNPGCG